MFVYLFLNISFHLSLIIPSTVLGKPINQNKHRN